jgi:aromatic ring hydroxylase
MTRAAVQAAEDGRLGQRDLVPAAELFRLCAGCRRCAAGERIIRRSAAHLLAAPPVAQMRDPELRPLIERYLRGAGDVAAQDRVRIFRLAWDLAGSALGSRGEQYERFYIGSSGRSFQRAHTLAAPERARRLVDRFVKEEL